MNFVLKQVESYSMITVALAILMPCNNHTHSSYLFQLHHIVVILNHIKHTEGNPNTQYSQLYGSYVIQQSSVIIVHAHRDGTSLQGTLS